MQINLSDISLRESRYTYKEVSEKAKLKWPYLVSRCLDHINDLVHENADLQQAADYFHGERDNSDFQHLEDLFGIGNAVDLDFTPLMRKHIEVLKGQLLKNPLDYTITCTDGNTIDAIDQEKHYMLISELHKKHIQQIQINAKYLIAKADGQNPEPPVDLLSEEQLEELQEYIDTEWKSTYEMSAQNVIDFLIQSNTGRFKTKIVTLFEDLMVYGRAIYDTILEAEGEDPTLEIVNPLDSFTDDFSEHQFLNDRRRHVKRKYLTPEEVLVAHGSEMSEAEKEIVWSYKENMGEYGNNRFLQTEEDLIFDAVNDGDGVGHFRRDRTAGKIPCYYVQWIDVNPIEILDYDDMELQPDGTYAPKTITRYKEDVYRCCQIGHRGSHGAIFVQMGLHPHAVSSQAHPWKKKLSINGLCNTDRNGKPYSLILQTVNLQDKYDTYRFLKDNVVALAGVKGIFMDYSMIPGELHPNETLRQLAFKRSVRGGHAPVNTAQEGINSSMNTVFSTYDLSLQYDTVQAYEALIESIENVVSSITGVPRQMLAQIEQRDAVANVQVGIDQGYTITKPMFHLMDNLMAEALSDLLKLCQISYKKGKRGQLLLGKTKSATFNIIPEKFIYSDYGLTIVDSDEIKMEMKEMKEYAISILSSKEVEIDSIFDIIRANSPAERAYVAKKHSKKKAAEQMQQALAQIEDLNKQLKEAQGQVQQTDQNMLQLEQQKLQLEKEKLAATIQHQNRDLQIKEAKMQGEIALKEKQVAAELVQITDSNPNNDEIKNIGN